MVIRWIIFRPNLDIKLHTSIWTFVIRFRQIAFSTKLLQEKGHRRCVIVYVHSHASVLLVSMLTLTVFLHTESIIESTENQTFGVNDVFYALWKVFTTLVWFILYHICCVTLIPLRKRKSFHYSDYPCFWSSIEGF